MRRPALHSASARRQSRRGFLTVSPLGSRRQSRRDFLAALGATGLSALAGCSTLAPRGPLEETPPDDPDAPWPTAHGTPANDGRAATLGPPDDSAVARWDLFEHADAVLAAYSAPVVGDEYAYVARVPNHDFDAREDASGRLFAVDPESETLAWTRTLTVPASGPPALLAGRVVVATTAGELLAFDAEDGTARWSRVLGAPAAPPTTTAGRVFVGDGDGRLHALAPDGTRVWSAAHGPAVEGPVVGTRPRAVAKPTVGEAFCFAVFGREDDRTLVAYRLRDGGVAWTRDYPGTRVGRPPAVDAGVLYLPESGGLRALDAATGEERWFHAFGTYRAPSTPAVGDSRVYVAAKNAYALDRETGRERWRYVNASTGHVDYRHPLRASPALADDGLYVGVGCLEAATGEARWGEFGNDPEETADYYGATSEGVPARGGPAVGDGALYVTMRYGRLYRFGGGR
ncbi:PQQ-binding-like beta-propeller repeat protein (plasmid) [Halarchaeum sp. CBA1220]|uniref:outer membrane protein assembly factor BamB family protein n=1 Tax=Halarchaeum sp. CBA1220 TaxID=1853682 RepID=UPI000F3AA0DA|nr:PQQ-binding-like beta-propeller repeat protein [Halarchaeum sp. CBA1220]QLC34973.1 PQQ-binding-like beta-propeller repeat protein [Halarchaeum sp. CBA1220]